MLTVNSIILIQEPDAVNSLSMVVVEEMPIDSLRLPNVWRFANLWCTPNLQSQHDILTLIQVKKKKKKKKKTLFNKNAILHAFFNRFSFFFMHLFVSTC